MDLGAIVGANIRERRELRGYTTTELSRKMGRPGYSSQISGWERGKCVPSAYCLCELADVLHCTVDELLGRG